VVLRYLGEVARVDLEQYLAYLCDCTERASAGSVFQEIGQSFERYLTSILSSGAFALPLPATGRAVWEIAEAVTIVSLSRIDDFYAEAEAHTQRFLEQQGAAATLLAEAFRVQRLSTPRFGSSEPREQTLTHDWLDFLLGSARTARLVARPTTLRYQPPGYTSVPELGIYASAHLASLTAGISTGELLRA
jgi:hypothetical protein